MMNTALVMPVRLHNRMEGFLHSWGCFRFFLLALFLCAPAVVFSQQRWERAYGGTSSDWGESVQQTSDGGYIVAGYTWSFGAGYDDVYIIKTNASGDTTWTKTYGGTGSDEGEAVQQTLEGGYIIAGYTTSFGAGNWDVYLIKTNASGDTLWTRTYGDTGDEEGRSVQQTSDSGYIIAGMTTSFGSGNCDVYLIKTNTTGDTLWTKTYGGGSQDIGSSVRQTSDKGYIIVGSTLSFGAGSGDVYLIKTDSSGNLLWERTYGGADCDGGCSIMQTSDDGYIITGNANYSGLGTGVVYLIKTNASGDTSWTRYYGSSMPSSCGYFVQLTTDGGYIVAGVNLSLSRGSGRAYLIKTNASGDSLWTKTYGVPGNEFYSVQQTTDGGYIITGVTDSFGAGGYDVFLIKTDANGNVGVEDNSPGRIKPLTSNLSFSVVPNPFTSFTTLPGHEAERFSLYDISGRKVGVYRGDRIGSGLSAGVYFLRPQEGNAKPVRVVKVR